ncbi:hypothetical protein HDN1F_04220 [gamma proteobacterium HdN1]|nr:hypothetical protein HDN1F_04220 [gamma proteobacterium HdN1]
MQRASRSLPSRHLPPSSLPQSDLTRHHDRQATVSWGKNRIFAPTLHPYWPSCVANPEQTCYPKTGTIVPTCYRERYRVTGIQEHSATVQVTDS